MFIDIIVMFDEIVVLRVHGDVTGDGGITSSGLEGESIKQLQYYREGSASFI